MKIYTAGDAIADADRGAVIALGNFDGLHLGHQAVIDTARDIAGESGAPLGVAIFTPHPGVFFRPDGEPFLLMSDRLRELSLRELGVDVLYKIPFNDALREMDDTQFVNHVLHRDLGASHIVIGNDFRFGKDRCGTAETLKVKAGQKDMGVTAIEPIGLHDFFGKYGSTQIRDALSRGDVMHAAHMLSRPFTIDGLVIKGFQRGRTINFPTANVELGDYVQPRFGVYTAEVQLANEDVWYPGVANIGKRPTFGDNTAGLEVHIFDFDRDIYGQHIWVRLRSFIRPEQKFDNIDVLRAQIEQDALGARAVFGLKA